jgi:hypothetical protein
MLRPLRVGLRVLLVLFALSLPGPKARPDAACAEVLVKQMKVPADQGWADTGIDVVQGEAFLFRATGEITLQRGNPAAGCGPDGLEMVISQQPIPSKNTGALIGRVVQLIAVRKDEETDEEVRDEIIEYFYIGKESRAYMPLKGRLFLGVNENVFADNGGEFQVEIFRVRD